MIYFVFITFWKEFLFYMISGQNYLGQVAPGKTYEVAEGKLVVEPSTGLCKSTIILSYFVKFFNSD